MAFKESEDNDLSELALRIMDKGEDVFDLLDGYLTPCRRMLCNAYLPIATMTDFLDYIVVFSYSEFHSETMLLSCTGFVVERSSSLSTRVVTHC